MKPFTRARLETAAIVLGLLSFWPYVFGHRSLAYLAGLVLITAALIAVAVVRVRCVRQGFEAAALGANVEKIDYSDGAH